MIACKDSVRFSVLRREIYGVLGFIENIFQTHGYPVVITCGTEAHKLDDPHSNGFAIDIRCSMIPTEHEKCQIRDEMQDALGERYTVLYEPEVKDKNNAVVKGQHFHIQVRKDLWRSLIK